MNTEDQYFCFISRLARHEFRAGSVEVELACAGFPILAQTHSANPSEARLIRSRPRLHRMQIGIYILPSEKVESSTGVQNLRRGDVYNCEWNTAGRQSSEWI